MEKQPQKLNTSFRLSPAARELLRRLAAQSGLSMTSVLEIVIREHAKRAGITLLYSVFPRKG